jgi:hypothetical protein
MLKTLKLEIWWLAVNLSGTSQHNQMGTGLAILIGAMFFKEMARVIWQSLPRLWRAFTTNERAFRRTKVRSRADCFAGRPSITSLRTPRCGARLLNRGEYRHVCF